jgi:hypothetical protein
VLLGVAVAVVAWSEGYIRTSIVMACVSISYCVVLVILIYKMRRDKETAEKAFRYRSLVIIARVAMVLGLTLGAALLIIELTDYSHLHAVLQDIRFVIVCAGLLYISFSHKSTLQ